VHCVFNFGTEAIQIGSSVAAGAGRILKSLNGATPEILPPHGVIITAS
jgi:hypothetical protein